MNCPTCKATMVAVDIHPRWTNPVYWKGIAELVAEQDAMIERKNELKAERRAEWNRLSSAQ